MTSLFDPITLRGVTFRNRIWLPPMCQYQVSAQDGVPTDWHLVHYGSRAAGGFGLLIAEATGVVPDGRITPNCCGLWNDTQRDAWARIVGFAHDRGAAMGVQLSHAGRKGSGWWDFAGCGDGTVPPADGGWTTVAPSPIAFPGYATPREATVDDIQTIVAAFASAARRADEAGFDTIELHAAHGYLLFEFLSPLTNHRTDQYGGDFVGRTRLLIEVCDAVRAVWPNHKPLLVRISATEWLDGGWTTDNTKALVPTLAAHGVDFIDVSSGGNVPASIPIGPGYQVPLAAAVRPAGLPVSAVGLLTEPAQAQQVLDDGKADVIEIGRAGLRQPYWPLWAAYKLGADPASITQPSYRRGAYRKA
ncbi:MAG: NADH:flavin oxidoreductase/NADH oxidase [Propionibacteriaceae bacterium]|nr:NADH:flavin oxidoreductase/NADH oxidase [Propionibacteriaceae bacterium]